MAEREGQQFGNYRLTRLLGQGAFAEVYLAVQVYLGTEAALKVLHTQLASASEIEQFRLEARTIAMLVHPRIVRLLDFGVQEGTPYLLMDYAPNGSMRQLFPAEVPQAPERILPYVKQVAEALHYAHEQRLIHRDVKPENMLLGRSNEVLLSDFGIAMVAQSSSYQGMQPIAGTAAYMAPEQLQGKPRPASDQYALGVVVYEWLCGARPFQGMFTEIASQHVLASPPPLRQKVHTLSPAIEGVVLTALAKDPRERFASTRAFANALEQAIRGASAPDLVSQAPGPPSQPGPAARTEPGQPSIYTAETVGSVPPNQATLPASSVPAAPGAAADSTTVPIFAPSSGPLGYPPAYPAGWAPGAPGQPPPGGGIPRRTVVIAGAVGLALIGGGAAAAALLSPKSTGAPGTGFGQTPTATGTATSTATATATSTPTEAPTSPPSGLVQGTVIYTYTGHTNNVRVLAWSPNGKRIASGSDDLTAQVWDALTGAHAVVYSRHTSYVEGVAWSPDGKRIASGSADGTVQIWNPNTGQRLLTYHQGSWVNRIAWSPDGRYIASGDQPGGTQPGATGPGMTVHVWDASTGQTLFTYTRHTNGVFAVAWSPDGKYIASDGYDQTVQVWKALTGELVASYQGASYIFGLSWSPDSRRVAFGSQDTNAYVFDVASQSIVYASQGHTQGVGDVVWSPDGKYIATGSGDSTVQIINAANGTLIYTYQNQGGHMDALGWSPNSQLIASGAGTSDFTINVWEGASSPVSL